MLGLDACELGAQLLELLRLALCARVLLADKEGGPPAVDEVLDEAVPEYRAPGRKSLLEIRQLDPDDRSLAEYKRALLGPLPPAVGDLAVLKDQVFVLKEGVDYRVKITFKVHREIVSGLKCLHHTYRRGLRVDKTVYMVGSYGPSAQEYEFVTPVEEAPRGALVRGPYLVVSLFTDDDRTHHLSWEWGLRISQDWKD
ncbi:rho GDP-dissociation inhibitor 3 isoform X2 [Macaca fascicularis]|uniref:rho GDP-dissociation inhibitor 3 isoform X2 n=1 Tax=Macaca fascicularis TaxID=9541 RepID=UPI001E254858|nr:rho GDP-dissociation inhibitor 3 isoform X2 [Macaca fascicularis]